MPHSADVRTARGGFVPQSSVLGHPSRSTTLDLPEPPGSAWDLQPGRSPEGPRLGSASRSVRVSLRSARAFCAVAHAFLASGLQCLPFCVTFSAEIAVRSLVAGFL